MNMEKIVIDATERFNAASRRSTPNLSLGKEALASVIYMDDWRHDSREREQYIDIVNGLQDNPELLARVEEVICDGQDRGEADTFILDDVYECINTYWSDTLHDAPS